MKYSEIGVTVDELDKAILRQLQRNSRISNADLARKVNLSPPAVHARTRRLEQEGLIDRYVTLLDKEKAGYDMLVFFHVSMQLHHASEFPKAREVFLSQPEVLECYHVTGDYDYLLKVVIHSRKDLERFVVECLTPTPGVARIQTCLVLSQVKFETELPL